jgi:SNF2 family DNA or RNA helicase
MQLYKHQIDGVRRIIANPRYALWWDTGVGKTATALTAMEKLRAKGEVNRVLVLCPKSIIDAAWAKDARQWAPAFDTMSYHDKRWTRSARDGRAAHHPVIDVVNYESFRVNVADFPTKSYDMVVIDESSKLKQYNSKISKLMQQYTQAIPRVVLLSGTPAPNSPFEYWSQMYCIDPAILGPRWYSFRSKYGICKTMYLPKRVDVYEADPDLVPDILDRVRTKSHSLRKIDCVDLPEQQDVVLEIPLSRQEYAAYDTMHHDSIVRLQETEIVASTALTELMKLRQVCNGWMYDEKGEAHVVGHSKLLALADLLEQIGQQTIIWVEYREDAERISEMLGDDCCELLGGMSQGQRNTSIQRFLDGEAKYLIAHPMAAGHGLTFVNSSYCIYYGIGYSYELHHQSRARIHRIGQSQRCTYYYLLAQGTMELEVMDIVRGKKSAHDWAMEFLHHD